MRLLLLLMLLLCSCATQRQAEKYFEENPEKLAEYVDKNKAYNQQFGGTYAAKHFPPKHYPPAIEPQSKIIPARLIPTPMLVTKNSIPRPLSFRRCPECRDTYITKTVYLQDTLSLDSLSRELKIELMANQAIRKKLRDTEVERDYWQEMNRKKLWTLIAMGVFAFLYILFKILAGRVRETET